MEIITINNKTFEIIVGIKGDYILYDLLSLNGNEVYLLYPTIYQCYKNPCKKKVIRYSSNLLFMKSLDLGNFGYTRHIGITMYNAKTFTQRFIMEIENFHYIVDIGFDKNIITICSENYTEAVDKLKNLWYNK